MDQPTGFLLVNKPTGMTSHDVIDALRRVTGIKKIGHAGTLDPFASGLLLVAVGRAATKHLQTFVGLDKVYAAIFVLGATTPTLDPESAIEESDEPAAFNRHDIESAMHTLMGDIDQIPPMHSAIKIDGKKLYELARKGQEVERKARPITIHAFDLLEDPVKKGAQQEIPVRIHCSSGTYIRALARDLGAALNSNGYVRELERSSIGNFDAKDATDLEEITSENWLTLLKTNESMGIDDA